MRKAIVSLGAGPQARLLRLAAATFRPYARRHGYDLHLHTELLAPDRPASWSKVPALQRLQDRYDVLVWLDADVTVVDPRVDFASELRDGRFLYMVEHETAAGRMPNAGVIMLRTGEDCAEFLDRVWEQREFTDHVWWENAAICTLLGYDLEPVRPARPSRWRERTRFVGPEWNSIWDARAPQPRFNHYPGFKLRTRTAFMLRDLAALRLRRR